MKAVVAHAQLVRSLHVSAVDFDADPNLLAVTNGVVDLRTGEFRLATGADLLKRQAAVAYDKAATAPEWKQFLKEVCCCDASFGRYLMTCAGYTLYGHAREQKFFALRGSGANGKGVCTRLLKRALGTYATTISPNVLSRAYSGNPNSPSPALAQLAGARMYLCSEGITEGKIDDAFLKQVSGGDELSARFSYGEMVSFSPVGKLWLTTNHALRISYSDAAMWRRIVPLPFDAEFRGAKMDSELEERLWKNEAAGILNFFIRGAVRYAAEGFPELPERLTREVRSMRREADPLEWWIRTHCSIDPLGQVRSSAAYTSYTDFARVKGIPQLGVKQFSSLLRAKGYAHGRDRAGAYYGGLVLEA
jgi:P4 family phage/plasmid primase-like protien